MKAVETVDQRDLMVSMTAALLVLKMVVQRVVSLVVLMVVLLVEQWVALTVQKSAAQSDVWMAV